MNFFLKQPIIKWASLIISVTIVTFFACKRTADVQVNNETFNVKQAKEWYYAYFNKSAYFKNLNTNSPFITTSNKSLNARVNDVSSSNLIKSPKWGLAKSFIKNGLQIVEMPILYNLTTVLLPGTQNESDNTKKQMANASLNKILFIKQPNGSVAIRLVTIVPTVAYATSKNFDISTNSCDNLDNNFSGYVMVKKWDETPVTTTKILNGTTYQKVTMVKRTGNNISGKINNSNNLREESQTQEAPCDPWIWVPKVYKTCAIAYQGDEPDHECEEWNQVESPTEGTWEYNPACEDTGEFDEEDLCLLFGIGCPDDEDDDPCEMYGICPNEDDDQCAQYADDALSIMDDALESATNPNEITVGESTYSTVDENGVLIQTKEASANTDYLEVSSFIIGNAKYTAYYTTFLSRPNNNSVWLFSKPANLVTYNMSSGSIRPCFSMDHTLNETAKNIRADKKQVSSNITYSSTLKFTCAFTTITTSAKTRSIEVSFLSHQFQ